MWVNSVVLGEGAPELPEYWFENSSKFYRIIPGVQEFLTEQYYNTDCVIHK